MERLINVKNSTYEPYRDSPLLLPDYDYWRLYKALAESGAEEYMNDYYTLQEYSEDES